jgi:hypothetical protein
MYARYKAAGHKEADVHVWLKQEYGIEDDRAIKRSDYDAIVARLDKTAPLFPNSDDDIPFDDPR